MQPIQTVKNQYQGINAHLHSYWQGVRGWNNFHNGHITYLTTALKASLLPMGYTAETEDSIQIRRADEYPRRPRSDITIHDLKPERYTLPATSVPYPMTGLVVPLQAVLEENPVTEKLYRAVAIYQYADEQKPVAWLEVLSPSNKTPGDDAFIYLQKRENLLDSGIVFIEIDYLHELPPTLPRIPDYSRLLQFPARPYRIVVLDPRPEVETGWASINEFAVDEPIPSVVIPLNQGDTLAFDFNAPYQKQFEEFLYGLDQNVVDYSRLPVNFDRYSEADRLRILARMLTVIEAAKQGQDLTQAPLPRLSPPVSLDEGLALLEKAT